MSKEYFTTKPGRLVMVDCEDTLVMWDLPEDMMLNDDALVTVSCREHSDRLYPNKYNIELIKKMAKRGHEIIIWSGGGQEWAEAVVKALNLEEFVSGVIQKPTYFIDDIADPKHWMGKHGYFDSDGNRSGHQMVYEKKV